MKPYLLTALLFLSLHSFSQSTTPTDSTAIEQYCLVRVYEIALNSKVEISVDYGEMKKTTLFGADILRDKETGKRKKFNSEVDALNYFGSTGWKLVNAFPVVEKNDSYTRYLFKKKLL